MKLEIRANRPNFKYGIDFYIFQSVEGKRYLGRLTFEEISKRAFIDEPTISLDMQPIENTAQVLMDDLWSCGIRPTEGAGSAGSLKATEYHLEDMRKLVFEEKVK